MKKDDVKKIEEMFESIRPSAFNQAKTTPHYKREISKISDLIAARKANHAKYFDDAHPTSSDIRLEERRLKQRMDYIDERIIMDMENWVSNYPAIHANTI